MNTRKKLVLLPVLGVLSVALYILGQVALGNRNTYICQSNLKQIGLGLLQYVRDYDEKTVLAGNWKKAVSPWLKNDTLFNCPSANTYALNRHLSGVSLGDVDDGAKIPTVFDSTSQQINAADFGASYVTNGAHSVWKRGRGNNVLFFDGHVKWMQTKPAFRALTPLALPNAKKKAVKTRVLPGKTLAAR